MSEVYKIAILVALTAAFLILFIGKIGLRDKIIERAPSLISQLFDCDFCLSFWTSSILAGILALLLGDPRLLYIPVLTTPITRFLL